MKGDFTRWTFDPKNHFTRVLLQQGRVQLDADWNEQAAILLHTLRSLAEDLIGPYGAPPNPDGTAGSGFRPAVAIGTDGKVVANAFRVLAGRYYVGGYLVETGERSYEAATWPWSDDGKTHLLYLDVWEELVTPIQDDRMREVALGGADTAVRARLTSRIRALPTTETACLSLAGWRAQVESLQPKNRGRLRAQARPRDPQSDDNPCMAAPDARYTGENQLYRVEIHQGTTATQAATFKWSRENGSVTLPIERLAASSDNKTFVLTLESLGRDGRFGLAAGDWVEALDDDSEDGARPLLQVDSVDADRLQVTFQGSPPALDLGKHPFLRRWDQKGRTGSSPQGDLLVKEAQWLELESGIQIWFEPAPAGASNTYRAGDYWLIPARTATGDVEWPQETTTTNGTTAEGPQALPPHGVEHRYAPLGLVAFNGSNVTITDCRTTFGERALILDTGVADWQVVVPPGTPGPVPIRPADIVTTPNPAWALLPPAQWISAQADPNQLPEGAYTYLLDFDLCSCFRNVMLSLSMLADNSVQVFLNDSTDILLEKAGPGGFKNPPAERAFLNPAGLVPGKNRLRAVVQNNGGPSGFILQGRIEIDRCC